MKGMLWSFVSAIAVVLQGAADIPIQPNFDVTKLKLKWHAIAVVLDQGEPKSTMGSVTKMKPVAGGDIIMTKLIPGRKRCKEEKKTLFSTDEPGKFSTLTYSTIRIVETDYKNYCIHHIVTREGVNAMHLYTRKPEASKQIKTKFETIACSLGFSKDKIIYLSKPAPCLK